MVKRTNCFSVVVEFYDSNNDKTITVTDLVEYCENNECISRYFIIKHDKDIDKNGKLVRLHYHAIIVTSSDYSSKTIINDISKNLMINRLCVGVRPIDCITGVRYLVHLDEMDSNKHHYNIDEVITNDSGELMSIVDYKCSLYDLSVDTLIKLCLDKKSLSAVYRELGLSTSLRYSNLIKDIYKDCKAWHR